VENGLGDLWAILDFTNPGLVGPRPVFVEALSRSSSAGAGANGGGGSGAARSGEQALRALNGLLVFRRTKAEPEIACELPDKIDEMDHCAMTPEQVGLYQAVLDHLLSDGPTAEDPTARKGHVLAAITHLKQICDHPAAYLGEEDDAPLDGRSGKLARLEELTDAVFSAGERMLIFTHFARWGERLAGHLTKRMGCRWPATTAGSPAPPGTRWSRPSRGHRPGGAGGLHQGRRHRAQPHRRQPRRPLRPLVEPGGGGPGPGPRLADRPAGPDRDLPPAGLPGHGRRACRGGGGRQRRIADLVLPASSSLGDLGAKSSAPRSACDPDAIVEEVAASRRDGDAEEAA